MARLRDGLPTLSQRPSASSQFLHLTPRQFEELVASYLRQQGCVEVTRVGGAGDRGIDVRARDQKRQVVIAQCKHYANSGKPVTPKEIREFLGAMTMHRAAIGYFATSSSYSQQARRDAAGHNIRLLDPSHLAPLLYQPRAPRFGWPAGAPALRLILGGIVGLVVLICVGLAGAALFTPDDESKTTSRPTANANARSREIPVTSGVRATVTASARNAIPVSSRGVTPGSAVEPGVAATPEQAARPVLLPSESPIARSSPRASTALVVRPPPTPMPIAISTDTPTPVPEAGEGIPADARPATVVRILDGDTIRVVQSGTQRTVQLLLIEAPPASRSATQACFQDDAATALDDLIPAGSQVWLEQDLASRDSAGRTLAYVWSRSDDDDRGYLVNEILVRQGYASSSPRILNIRHLEEIQDAETIARAMRLGMWGTCRSSP